RHSRSGDRQLNRADDDVVRTRVSYDTATCEHVERRRAEGLYKREIRRCLRRDVGRSLFREPRPRMACHERIEASFSRQVRLGEVGSGAAEDLVLLLKQPDLFARLTQLGRFLPALAGAVAVVDVGLADPLMERDFVDAEVLRDLRDGDAVLTG